VIIRARFFFGSFLCIDGQRNEQIQSKAQV
jgi:hypothetical protein